jgi:hypothetical protein
MILASQGGDGAEFLTAPIKAERGKAFAAKQGTEVVANEAAARGAAGDGPLHELQVNILATSQEQCFSRGDGLPEPAG